MRNFLAKIKLPIFRHHLEDRWVLNWQGLPVPYYHGEWRIHWIPVFQKQNKEEKKTMPTATITATAKLKSDGSDAPNQLALSKASEKTRRGNVMLKVDIEGETVTLNKDTVRKLIENLNYFVANGNVVATAAANSTPAATGAKRFKAKFGDGSVSTLEVKNFTAAMKKINEDAQYRNRRGLKLLEVA